jgi:anti-sigma28 factor (negative regulator of flagellin synthesis)
LLRRWRSWLLLRFTGRKELADERDLFNPPPLKTTSITTFPTTNKKIVASKLPINTEMTLPLRTDQNAPDTTTGSTKGMESTKESVKLGESKASLGEKTRRDVKLRWVFTRTC